MIKGHLEALRRRKTVNGPIELNLSEDIVEDLAKAKRVLFALRECQESGVLADTTISKNKIMQSLTDVKPKDWNNVAIPVTDFALKIIQSVYSLSSIQVHLQSYMDDLSLVTKNMMIYHEATTDNMRKNISSRFGLLNEKSEDEVKSLNLILDNKIDEKVEENAIDLTNKFDVKLRELENRMQNYT